MIKSAIFSFIPVTEKSMVASTKVAWFIHRELEIPLTWNADIGEMRNLDVLLIVNGAYAFCKHLEPLSHAIRGARRIVWVQQDYSIVPPINDGDATSPFRKAFVDRRKAGKSHLDFWTTCEKESKTTEFSSYINWNCLAMQMYQPLATPRPELVYYGSFRIGRQKYFDTYFKDPKVSVTISSPTKKFQNLYTSSKISHVPAADNLIPWLSLFGLGLYLEDKKSHSEFHSPPNRFYEMLSAHLPMVFQPEAGYTLRKAGYKDIDRFTVATSLAVERKMDIREELRKAQHGLWYDRAMEERLNLSEFVKQAWRKLHQ